MAKTDLLLFDRDTIIAVKSSVERVLGSPKRVVEILADSPFLHQIPIPMRKGPIRNKLPELRGEA